MGITYVNFVNRGDGEGWKDSSNGTMGMYKTLKDMQEDVEREINRYKTNKYYEDVTVERADDECIVTYKYNHWRNNNKAKEVIIYKLLEFDLDKYAEENE